MTAAATAGATTALAAPSRRIGLFGGSFDPVHVAHVALAREALTALQLDELRWVPAGQPWQKARALAPARHREAMVRLAIAGEPRFVLERIELEHGGPSYTIDTVRALQAREPGATWFLIIGADQHAGLQTWRDWAELLERVVPAVAARPGVLPPVAPEVARRPSVRVPLPPMEVSSTEIRRRVAAGQDIAGLVPVAVASYIDREGLYRLPANPAGACAGHRS